MIVPPMLPPPVTATDVLKGIDNLVRSDFEAFRNTCFNWLLISTGVVAAGLLFEMPEIWHDSVKAIRGLRQSPKPNSEISPWVKLLVSLGWLLIVVGVVGEFVADSFVSKADGIVQTFDEMLLTDAQRRTAVASERASAAYERAARTEQVAAQENERAAKAEQQAQEENERAAKALEAAENARKEAEGLQLQIAHANERAANAELETERLRKQLADRTLTDEQVVSIGNKLRIFRGQLYTLTAYWDSKESLGIANRIHAALQNVAGWSYSDEGSKSMLLGGEVGVLVWTHPNADETTKRAAKALIDSLNAEGIEAAPREQNPKNPKSNMININVGSKR